MNFKEVFLPAPGLKESPKIKKARDTPGLKKRILQFFNQNLHMEENDNIRAKN